MIDRTGPSIIAAYQRSITFLESRGFKPLLQRLDNEATAALQEFLAGSGINFQLAPPHVHRCIVAMPPSALFEHSRITSLQACAQRTQIFR
jgi:hypothetical protein